MADLIPDPLPDAKVWKREIFKQIDALLNPKKDDEPEESPWATAWSYRYGTLGRRRPDYAAYLDILVACALVFLLLEITSYNAYSLKFQNWFRTTILRRPQLNIESVVWERMVYRIQAANQASLQHAQYYVVDPFAGLGLFERIYGKIFIELCKQIYFWIASAVFILAYIIWFLVKYWAFVKQLVTGSFFTMLKYIVKLSFCIIVTILPLGLLRFFGIRPKWPSFIKSTRDIRRMHVNWWILQQMLKYTKKWHELKEKTLGALRRSLLETPALYLLAWYRRFKKVHVDLSYLDFLRIVVALHPIYTKNPDTKKYIDEHGFKAANQRFFTTVSKALHYARRKRQRETQTSGKKAAKGTPEWWRYLPVMGLYLLIFIMFALSIYLWMASLGHAPVSWDYLQRAMARR